MHAVLAISPHYRYPADFAGMTTPFPTAEEAWLWTAQALRARRDGARSVAKAGLAIRPCEPDDIVRCLDGLFRRGRIGAAHATALHRWGERGMAPDAHCAAEQADAGRWQAALAWLDWALRAKGIVA